MTTFQRHSPFNSTFIYMRYNYVPLQIALLILLSLKIPSHNILFFLLLIKDQVCHMLDHLIFILWFALGIICNCFYNFSECGEEWKHTANTMQLRLGVSRPCPSKYTINIRLTLSWCTFLAYILRVTVLILVMSCVWHAGLCFAA